MAGENNLSGQIPTEIGNLIRLFNLGLGKTSFASSKIVRASALTAFKNIPL